MENAISAARAALLTGAYPLRCGLPDVHSYGSPFGLHPEEVTLAEILKTKGYATACIGKWHLGEDPKLGPNRQGFDYFYGTRLVNGTQAFETFAAPIWRNEQLLSRRSNHARFTQDSHREAMQFIEEHRDRPFFLYLAHLMPHVPIYPGDGFRRRSPAGLYADAVEEIDFYVGRLMAALKTLEFDEHTLVIFTSDNGPWAGHAEQSGSAAPLRGSKLTTWEGGFRVPCIARWPGQIPAGRTCREIVTQMDFLPTIAALTGAPLSSRRIDGRNVWPLLAGTSGATSPHEAFFFYAGSWLQAVRAGRWKLHLARERRESRYGWCAGWFTNNTTLMATDQLYDLDSDIGEAVDVAAQHPQLVAQLRALAAKAREDIGDYDIRGHNARPIGSSMPEYPDPIAWQRSPHAKEANARNAGRDAGVPARTRCLAARASAVGSTGERGTAVLSEDFGPVPDRWPE
ncbi:MAG: sulfatase-like hydrolase/transferase [Verrucomicrobiota bacterium]|nr:sulfatase-like hydrolase/transferase [Verrucomicrobiota bacterium]